MPAVTTEAGARGRKRTSHQPATPTGDRCGAARPPESAHAGPRRCVRRAGPCPPLRAKYVYTAGFLSVFSCGRGWPPWGGGTFLYRVLREAGPSWGVFIKTSDLHLGGGVRDPVRHGDPNLVADSPASRRLRLFRVPDKTVLASRFLQVSLVFRVYKTAPTACACRRSGAPAP